MHERRLKPRKDYSSIEIRRSLVCRFNDALGPPSKADLAIQQAFLQGTMTPGEAQLFISMCEFVIDAVGRHKNKPQFDE
jgi:hypothetical protein